MDRPSRRALLLLTVAGWLAACASSRGVPRAGSGAEGDAGSPDAAASSTVVSDAGSVEVFQTSRAGDKVTGKGALPVYGGPDPSRSIIAVSATQKQTVLGFGGAITESVAAVLAALPPQARREALGAYFSPDGSGYTLARTHIASCDFSLASYQYSTTVDPTLADFSVAHDEALLIPALKDAVAASGGALKILASPWSAPAWMKTPPALYSPPTAANGYAGYDPPLASQYYGAYALYLSKYVQAYKAEGVDIWAITPQNEPLGNGGQWETMSWTYASMNTFLKQDLGPRFQADGVTTKIFVYDHNKGDPSGDFVQWAKEIYQDPTTSPLVYGSAVHWYGSTVDVFEPSLEAVHALDPTKPILFTEGTLDGLTDRAGGAAPSAAYQYAWMSDDFYWVKDEYDWGYWYAVGSQKALHPPYEPVYRYARDIIVGLNHWYAGWIDWNIALDRDGGPNHVHNWCGAGLMVDLAAQTIYYTPIFYVMRQFSRFIRPGAIVLDSSVTLASGVSVNGVDGQPTDGLLATAARNPDGSVAIVLFNETAAPIDYDVTLPGGGGQAARGTAPAQSIQTLVWAEAPFDGGATSVADDAGQLDATVAPSACLASSACGDGGACCLNADGPQCQAAPCAGYEVCAPDGGCAGGEGCQPVPGYGAGVCVAAPPADAAPVDAASGG